jgi:hypothetical protein
MMAILRGLGGRVLPCGCLVGVYETYRALVVAAIDATHPDCHDPRHIRHARIVVQPESETAARSSRPSRPSR